MIKVLIAEDQHLVRGALVALLEQEADLKIVAELSDGDTIVGAARDARPDVAVLDIDLPGKDGISAAVELREALPDCRTLILTILGRPGAVRRALDARVNGYLLKDSPPSKLANAIRQVSAGRRVVDSELALAAWETEGCPLAAREIEVLRLVSYGGTVDDVASSLFLSSGTVRNYLTSIVSKLGARSRVDAIRIADKNGWI